VTVDKGIVEQAQVQKATGVEDDPQRKVEFAADDLDIDFGDKMTVREIHGRNNAHLASAMPGSRTTVKSNQVDLAFVASGSKTLLSGAGASGNSVATSEPVERAGVEPPETRILRSEVIRVAMSPDGREIREVETDGAATLEFTPNRPAQAHRS